MYLTLTSVIVASHRENSISSTLDSITNQITYLTEHYEEIRTEIIVVTDYPNGHFQTMFPMVKWIYTDNKSISIKRNIGLQQAKGAIVAFVDDDCMPDLLWLNEGSEYLLQHEDCAGVEGLTTIETSDTVLACNVDYKRLERPGFRTNNIFYRKCVLDSVGGFDENFSLQREDMDLAFRLLEKGYKIDYDSNIRVTHALRPNEWYDLIKSCWNKRFDPLLYRKHRKLYRKYIRSPFPPSLLFLFVCYCLTILTVCEPTVFKCVGFFSIFVSLGVVARRIRKGKKGLLIVLREVLLVMTAPFVLVSALLFGNIKYRSFLFV
ncbi:MAG: glycosyltransferase [Fibrobacter sp.]|nr:glycosyltransferase [Fibrobacter sp.]